MNQKNQSIDVKNSTKIMIEYVKNALKIEVDMINVFCEKKLFGNFYKVFLKVAFLYFNERIALYPEISFESVLNQIYERVENIPMRILIADIHSEKDADRLMGENSYEEYEYYQRNVLNNDEYVGYLCNQFPVMEELILYQIYQFVEYLCEIQNALKIDKEIIQKNFCNNEEFSRVSNIMMNLSDPHRKGKTVAKIDLDNGYSIIYKPHNLRKETLMNEIYQVFMENSSFQFKILEVIDRETYGWERYIETKECDTEDGVKLYFERMGFLLFICYLFGATDIHCENIIASGEFPILIDLETIPGVVWQEASCTVEAYVDKKISNSVMRTGILPTMVWGKNGEGVIVSALGNSTKMKTPFKLPYVINEFSSDIQVAYMQKDISIKGSLPVFQGNIIGAAPYSDQICYGFEEAYRLYMHLQTKLKPMIKNMLEQKGRFIFRHTQQYSMYLNISFYPQFLKSWDDRHHFFENLNEHNEYIELYQYEKRALIKMDIPIFEIDVKNGNIYDGESKKYALKNFTIDKGYFEMNHLCESDLVYQIKCIKLSLDMLTERRLPEIPIDKEQEDMICKEKIVTNIADYICSSAVVFKDDISWDNIIFYDNNTWKLAPIGLDLYDGVGGIAIFLASVNRTHPSELYEKTLKLVQNKLFNYTDGNGIYVQNLRTKDSGILKGEGSIIYTYIILYKITKDKKYLFYAEKHFSKFEEIILQCKNPDYLSGSAGAIIVLTKLYAETNNRRYLDVAEILGENIWKMAKKQKNGYGIVSDEDKLPPLAGMAHGVSGYIMAYAYLLENVNNPLYYERIKELLKYENNLFDFKSGDWRDLRKVDPGPQNTVAWCHGAPGIVIARIKLNDMEEFSNDKEIKEDIFKCLRILESGMQTSSICLCHGLMGNYWITRYVYKKIDIDEIVERIENPMAILPRERYNFSLMTGITGMGLFFNNEELCQSIFI